MSVFPFFLLPAAPASSTATALRTYQSLIRVHELLLKGASIKCIAIEIGQPDLANFNRWFQRHWGISPRQCQQLLAEVQAALRAAK
jgi:AraC-like DNA-binding protein